jgi:hypothetical protein
MNEMTEKAQQDMVALEAGCLCGFLQESSVKLRSGEDAKGIEALLSAMSELEKLVENDQNSLQPRIDLQRLLPAVRTLCFYIKNKDIAGIADLLEDVFYPLTREWMEGSDGI